MTTATTAATVGTKKRRGRFQLRVVAVSLTADSARRKKAPGDYAESAKNGRVEKRETGRPSFSLSAAEKRARAAAAAVELFEKSKRARERERET